MILRCDVVALQLFRSARFYFVFMGSQVYFETAVSVLQFKKKLSVGDALHSRWDAMDGSPWRWERVGRAQLSRT